MPVRVVRALQALSMRVIRAVARVVRAILRAFNRVSHDHPFLLALVVLLAVAVPGYLRIQSLSNCTNNWANAYQDRVSVLTVANASRQDALDNLVRSIGTGTDPSLLEDLGDFIGAHTEAQRQMALRKLIDDSATANRPFQFALHRYIAKSDAYNEVLRTHPIKAIAEKLNC